MKRGVRGGKERERPERKKPEEGEGKKCKGVPSPPSLENFQRVGMESICNSGLSSLIILLQNSAKHDEILVLIIFLIPFPMFPPSSFFPSLFFSFLFSHFIPWSFTSPSPLHFCPKITPPCTLLQCLLVLTSACRCDGDSLQSLSHLLIKYNTLQGVA